MHEMGIALEIIDIVKASIPAEMADARVAKIHLKIGRLSAIVSQSLRFCFEIAVKDTALEDAILVIDELPVVAECKDCQFRWTIEGPAFSCQRCQSGAIELLSGRELDIHSIEIEDEEMKDA